MRVRSGQKIGQRGERRRLLEEWILAARTFYERRGYGLKVTELEITITRCGYDLETIPRAAFMDTLKRKGIMASRALVVEE